jgi:protein phosphatase
MQQALPVIYCPNLKCRTVNPEGERTCQNCGARLPNRYLWVIGLEPEADKAQTSLADRYSFRGPQVVIDTQPGLPLASTFDITDDILPYLKLFSWRLHIPQIYSLLPASPGSSNPLVLLENAPLAPQDFSPAELSAPVEIDKIAIAGDFTEAWKQASSLRQINWLWQVAQLWVPFQREGVAASLINPERMRVEGPLLRLVSLDYQADDALPLSELGLFWAKWCLPSVGRWKSKFTELCDRLMEGQITTVDPLLDDLEAWLQAVRTTSKIQIDVATRTDSGPTREHNEDACYPMHGTVTQNAQEGLVIVCDGVGGHEGGEVASGIAISVLTSHLKQTPLQQLPPEEVMLELETAVGLANDQIAEQNDQENRHDRDRMGTTAVMALAQNQDLYIANIGDSRAYLITKQACYQLTTDDDIATREVRLGYLPYREALRQPGAGSLIQALGMVPSSMLRPAASRFLLDSDCLFLLCSDGLSDFERVESLWRDELLPLLLGETDLAEATKSMISAANRLNGHDNVTVALLHCHKTDVSVEQSAAAERVQAAEARTRTRNHSPVKKAGPPALVPWIVGILALFGIGAGLAFFFRQPEASTSTEPTPSETSPSAVASLAPAGTPTLEIGTYWKIQPAASTAAGVPAKLGFRTVTAIAAPPAGLLLPGTVLKILGTQQNKSDPASWLKVQLCQVPSTKASSPAVASSSAANPVSSKGTSDLKLGEIGYVEAAPFSQSATQIDSGASVGSGALGTKLKSCPAVAPQKSSAPPNP